MTLVFVLLRALVYASAFIAALLVFIPRQLLGPAQLATAVPSDPVALAGIVATVAGSVVALWCIGTFVVLGRGTPAPFDPPRRLVVRGPYRYVRNPMYLGAGLALAGAALVYRSTALLGYLAVLGLIVHGLVVWYEEPTLTNLFGDDYLAYRRDVRRWLPRRPRAR